MKINFDRRFSTLFDKSKKRRKKEKKMAKFVKTINRKKNGMFNEKISLYTNNDSNSIKKAWISLNNDSGNNRCGHLFAKKEILKYWSEKEKNDPICPDCELDYVFASRCMSGKYDEEDESTQGTINTLKNLPALDLAMILLDLQNIKDLKNPNSAILIDYISFKGETEFQKQSPDVVVLIIALLAKKKKTNEWKYVYDSIFYQNSRKAFHNFMVAIVYIQSQYMTGDLHLLLYPKFDVQRRVVIKRPDFHWLVVPFFDEMEKSIGDIHGKEEQPRWVNWMRKKRTPVYFRNAKTLSKFSSTDRSREIDIIYVTLLLRHNNFQAFYRPGEIFDPTFLKGFVKVIWSSEWTPIFASLNMFEELMDFFYEELPYVRFDVYQTIPQTYTPKYVFQFGNEAIQFSGWQSKKLQTLIDRTDTKSISFLIGYYQFFNWLSTIEVPDSLSSLSITSVNDYIFSNKNEKIDRTKSLFQMIFFALRTFVSYIVEPIGTEESDDYIKNLQSIYDNPWVALIKQSIVVNMLIYKYVFQFLLDSLHPFLDEYENRHIYNILNVILKTVSPLLGCEINPETKTKSNKFYDMISDMLVDLKAQKQVDLKLIVNVIPGDDNHILVQLAPRRKKWLGIFAKQSSIDYPISGTQRSFLTMEYVFPPGRRPTTEKALNDSVPNKVILQFMDLKEPAPATDPNNAIIHSIPLFDRIELSKREKYPKKTLDDMWVAIVRSFTNLGLKVEPEAPNRKGEYFAYKAIIFNMDPKKPLTVRRLRSHLSLIPNYTLFLYK